MIDVESSGFIRRSVEFRAIADFLMSAERQPSGLVIEGEAGIGKTTLWLAALDEARARGFRVLPARVGQAESVLAYAALADLLSGVEHEVIAGLPEVQRLAVYRVLLRASDGGHPTDQHTVAAAFASVVDRIAVDVPLLVAIDDVQWLDPPSQMVLAFVTRRLNGRIGLLATERVIPTVGSRYGLAGPLPLQTWLHRANSCRAHEPRRNACLDLRAPRPNIFASDDGANL